MTDGKPIRSLKFDEITHTTSTVRRDIFRKAKRELEKEYGEVQLTNQQALEGICVDYLLRRKQEKQNG